MGAVIPCDRSMSRGVRALTVPWSLLVSCLLGNSAFAKNDHKGAIAAFTEALTFDPNNVALLSNRSAAYAAIGKDDRQNDSSATANTAAVAKSFCCTALHLLQFIHSPALLCVFRALILSCSRELPPR